MPQNTENELKTRTKDFALRIIRLYAALPHRGIGEILGKHLLRSGTSVGARYRDAARTSVPAEFDRRIEAVTQAVEETVYWIELIGDSGTLSRVRLQSLRNECDELLSIFTAMANRAALRDRDLDS